LKRGAVLSAIAVASCLAGCTETDGPGRGDGFGGGAPDLVVEETALVPSSLGGRYDALVLVRNESSEPAGGIGSRAQLEITDGSKLIKTVGALDFPIIPPDGLGMIKESAIRIPDVANPRLGVQGFDGLLSGSELSGVKVVGPRYNVSDRFGETVCTVTGELRNDTAKPQSPSLSFAGFANGELVTGGGEFDLLDFTKIFPDSSATFKFSMSGGVCPPAIDDLEVYVG
jgi:hypothetical protein